MRNHDQLKVRKHLSSTLLLHHNKWSRAIDKDRVEGAATKIKGKMKEGVGKVTGDSKT
jgi:hypothetical protein